MSQVSSQQFFGSVLKAIACTRNHNDDEQAYKHGVIEPAQRIRTMMKEYSERPVPQECVHEVLDLLEVIFRTKQVAAHDRSYYLQEILQRNNLTTTFANRVSATTGELGMPDNPLRIIEVAV